MFTCLEIFFIRNSIKKFLKRLRSLPRQKHLLKNFSNPSWFFANSYCVFFPLYSLITSHVDLGLMLISLIGFQWSPSSCMLGNLVSWNGFMNWSWRHVVHQQSIARGFLIRSRQSLVMLFMILMGGAYFEYTQYTVLNTRTYVINLNEVRNNISLESVGNLCNCFWSISNRNNFLFSIHLCILGILSARALQHVWHKHIPRAVFPLRHARHVLRAQIWLSKEKVISDEKYNN